MKIKENVKYLIAMDVDLDKVIKSLKFEFNYPVEVSGLITEDKVDLEFKMENGDQIKYYYDDEFISKKETYQWVSINGEKFELLGKFQIYNGIRKLYIEHLKKLIKKDS